MGVCYIHGSLTFDTVLLGQPPSCAHVAGFIEQTVRANSTALKTFSGTVRVGAEGAAIVLHKLWSCIPILLFYETGADGGLRLFANGRGICF